MPFCTTTTWKDKMSQHGLWGNKLYCIYLNSEALCSLQLLLIFKFTIFTLPIIHRATLQLGTLLRHGFDWLQHCLNIAMLSLRTADAFPVVTSLPLKNSYFPEGEKRRPEMGLLFAGYAMLRCAKNRRWESSHVSLHVTSRRPCRWSRTSISLLWERNVLFM